MSRSITEMSFDEIFPETPFPSENKYPSYSSEKSGDSDFNAFTSDIYENKDDYDYNDYGTDISSLEDDLRKNQFPDNAPPPPMPAQNFYQGNSQPQQFTGNNQTGFINVNTYAGNSAKFGGMNSNSYPVSKPNPENPSKSLIFGIVSIFLSGFSVVGLIFAIIGLVSLKKEKQEALEKGKPAPKSAGLSRGLCITGLVINLISIFIFIIGNIG